MAIAINRAKIGNPIKIHANLYCAATIKKLEQDQFFEKT